MKMTFRWYGVDDAIPLEYIRQIPGMQGIVSAIYDVRVGEVWSIEKITELKKIINEQNLELSVIESVPVHEDIKMGLETRDKYIENYKQTIINLGLCGIDTVCYNFMPIFDWTRSDLEFKLEDGSTCLIYDEHEISKMNPLSGELSLPGWDSSYKPEEMKQLFDIYANIDEEQLWQNLNYFVQAVMPVAKQAGVKMAIHPDDPPWNIFGLPRIIKSVKNLERFLALYDDPCNGLAFCTGSLGPALLDQIPATIRKIGTRINFMHIRNIKIIGEHSFQESAHMSSYGSIDIYEVIKALVDVDFKGPVRPDHGRMIFGETGRPGYGLYDRALGAQYLLGLYEAIIKERK